MNLRARPEHFQQPVDRRLLAEQQPSVRSEGEPRQRPVAGLMLGPDRIDRLPAELVPVVLAGQFVDLRIIRNRQHPADPGQVEMMFGMFREHAAVIGIQPLHAGRPDIFPIGIGHDGVEFALAQDFGDGAAEGIAADDQESPRFGFGDAQAQRQETGGGALQGHRADDDHEGQRNQQLRLYVVMGRQHQVGPDIRHFTGLVAMLFEAGGEHRRSGCGDDAPGGHPGDQGPLPPAQGGAPAGEERFHRRRHELNG